MDYKRFDDNIYVRLDRGDEVISSVLSVCNRENIKSAIFSGIGGCAEVTVGTLNSETNEFIPHNKNGLLEMVSLNGNIALDENDEISEHTHAMFTYINYDEVKTIGGHLIKAVISYTGEIVINPIKEGVIRKSTDKNLGIPIWRL